MLEFLRKCLTIDAESISLEVYQTAEFEFLVVSLITEGQSTSQLERGIGGLGQPLGFYSLFTEVITGGRKRQGQPYTLKETGFYYDSHRIETKLGSFTINADSTTNKDGDFLQKLDINSEEAQSLTDGNLQLVINEHKELFSEAFRELIDSFKTI